MSFPLLITGAVLILLFAGLTLFLQKYLRAYAPHGDAHLEASSPIELYRDLLGSLFRAQFTLPVVFAWVHYTLIHLLVPVVGLGLFLRTDGNFLVVFVGFVISFQLIQRVYPGPGDGEKDLPEEAIEAGDGEA